MVEFNPALSDIIIKVNSNSVLPQDHSGHYYCFSCHDEFGMLLPETISYLSELDYGIVTRYRKRDKYKKFITC